MLRMFQLIGEADHLLENAWRDRKWATFVRVWLMASVTLTALAFVTPFVFMYIPAFIYNVVAAVVGAKVLGISFFDTFRNLAVPFAAMVGLFALILTIPAMMLKQLSGDLHH
jgi:hypothetical protein